MTRAAPTGTGSAAGRGKTKQFLYVLKGLRAASRRPELPWQDSEKPGLQL